jgi:hypothetical protein
MARSFVAIIAAVGLATVLGDKNSFDCVGRNLAVEFAVFANPQISTSQLNEIADALVGSATQPCNITIPADVAAAHEQPRFRAFPIDPKAGATFYVRNSEDLYTFPPCTRVVAGFHGPLFRKSLF